MTGCPIVAEAILDHFYTLKLQDTEEGKKYHMKRSKSARR